MPTQRKRIGFLPRAEVQNIINEICQYNKLSQSKVTGILVEEALYSRGVLSNSPNKKSNEINGSTDKTLLMPNISFNNQTLKEELKSNLEESCLKDEIQMINEFIEFKFFKNIMNQKK